MNGGIFILQKIISSIMILIRLALPMWVYRDAENRGVNGFKWFIVVLVGGVLVLIIWLIIRPEEETTIVLDERWPKNNYK